MSDTSLLRALLIAALFGVFASARPAAAAGPKPPEPSTVYAFDDDLVRGDLVAPRGEVMFVRKHRASDSLVRARESFAAELLKSVESL